MLDTDGTTGAMRLGQRICGSSFVAMSSLILSYLDDDPTPVVYSMPPYVDSDGDQRPAKITVFFSVDEAEELARKLIGVVLAARESVYSERGHEQVRFSREEDLRLAWRTLGLGESGGED